MKYTFFKSSKTIKKDNEISMLSLLSDQEGIFLKVDIEGNEYEVLFDISDKSDKLVSLIIEFHDLEKI